MPKTIGAADSLLHSARPPDVRHRAGDLLLALAAVEGHVSSGGPVAVLSPLLRDLVILITRLAGRNWLDANADGTAAAFTALQLLEQSPPLPELDEILTRVLSDRFSLPQPHAAARQNLIANSAYG